MTHEQPSGRSGIGSYLVLGGTIILSLLVGLGIGMAAAGEADADTEITLPAAVQEVHDEWYTAWNEADGETAKSMMALGGRHYCPASGVDGVTGNDLAALVAKGFSVADIDTVGAISMGTPGDSSGVSQDHVIVTQHTLNGHEGYVSILHLRGQEDSLKILSHRAFP